MLPPPASKRKRQCCDYVYLPAHEGTFVSAIFLCCLAFVFPLNTSQHQLVQHCLGGGEGRGTCVPLSTRPCQEAIKQVSKRESVQLLLQKIEVFGSFVIPMYLATWMDCISSYSGPFLLKLHRNVIYSTLSMALFRARPLWKMVIVSCVCVCVCLLSPVVRHTPVARGHDYILCPNICPSDAVDAS